MAFEELLADAYREASLQQLDMVAVAQAFETIRRARPNLTDVVRAAEGQLAQSELSSVRRAIKGLRDQLSQTFYAQHRARVLEAMRSDPEQGWVEWLRTFMFLVTEAPGRAFRTLAFDEWPVEGAQADQLAELRRLTTLLSDKRWMDVRETLERIGSDDRLDGHTRALATESAAMIWLHILQREDPARERLQRAEALAPDCGRVAMGWTEYWVKQMVGHDQGERDRAAEQARTCAERGRRLAPGEPRGPLVLSDLERALANADESRRLLREALSLGSTEACFELINLALAEAPSGVEDPVVRTMFDLVVDMGYDREDDISATVRMADLLASHPQTAASAEAWYRRALEEAPDRLLLHVSLAYLLMDQGRLEEAGVLARRACELDPRSFEARNMMAWLAEARGDQTAAIDHLRRAGELQPSFDPDIRSRISLCLLRLGRLEEAEAEATAALANAPGNASAVGAVKDVAEAAYMQHGDPARAERLYETLRAFGGAAEQGSYRNLRGNLLYYRGDYLTAVGEYEQAVALMPHDAVIWSNLAHACELAASGAEQPAELLERSEESLLRAAELGSDTAGEADLARVRARLSILRRCGRRALDRVPVLTPAWVGLSEDLVAVVRDPSTGDLTDAMRICIQEMRDRIRAATGVPVPGVRFGFARNTAAQGPWLEMSILAVPVCSGSVTVAPADPIAGVLNAVEQILRRHLYYLLDQQTVRAALDGEDDEQLRAVDSDTLLRVTLAARGLVRQGQRIDWPGLVREVQLTEPATAPVTPAGLVVSS